MQTQRSPSQAAQSRALLTDLYQLTMAYGYWKSGRGDDEAVFELFFRQAPFRAGYAIAAGLQPAIEFIQGFEFSDDDLAYLAVLKGHDGKPLFETAFLDYLQKLRFACDLHAMPEGTAVFANEPLLRTQGPILQCQLLETPLLNLLNFQSLIATKAARICLAAKDDAVLEFGLRRAQGVDGALAASRAAYIGGCAATSNVLAGKLFGIPVRGTHAHSWVMSFEDEREAFRVYAETMPNNVVFLVDTYDTLEGVRRATEVGRWLRQRGHEMLGIRLDSGDLAWLSIKARQILDAAGFSEAMIMASNDLDETLIQSLKEQGATINVWGVGTRLVTAYDQPALGGVYKLTALRGQSGAWRPRLKLSEQSAKISTPGIHQVRRFKSSEAFSADGIYDVTMGAPNEFTIVDPLDATRHRRMPPGAEYEDLLVPVFSRGQLVYKLPALTEIRERTRTQVAMLHPGIKRLLNPHEYPVGLELSLHEVKTQLILKARGEKS